MMKQKIRFEYYKEGLINQFSIPINSFIKFYPSILGFQTYSIQKHNLYKSIPF